MIAVGVKPLDLGSPAPASSVDTSNTLAPGGTEVTSIVPLVPEAGCDVAFAGEEFDCEGVDAAPLALAALATLVFRRLLFARSDVAQAASIAKLPERNNTTRICEFVFKGCVSRSRVLDFIRTPSLQHKFAV